MKKGIDVSKWQGKINWEEVKNYGVEFAILREGYGKNDPKQVDKRLKENYNAAKSVGIPVGVYHYSYADSITDAINEAHFCLENIQGYNLEYPVVLDLEDKEQLKLSSRQRTDIVKTFCNEIEKNGYYSMVYTSLNWWNNYLITDELKQYDLWLAQWGVAKPSVECGIWQNSESGKVYGISGNVDLNIAYKDYPSIIKAKGLNGFKEAAINESNVINYTVKKNDTLTAIAKKYNTTVNLIAETNGIKDVDKIYVGQELKIMK